MLNPFVCGTFHHEEDDFVPCSSPKKSKRSRDNNKNPYSNRGLDKFSALLADLNERRQKVFSQMSPEEISFVRFAYSSNHDFVPIVVKVKNKDQKKHKSGEELKVRHLSSLSEQLEKHAEEPTVEETNKKHNKLELSHKKKKNRSFSWNMLKRQCFYVPAVVILILVFLTVLGRSVATLFTCVVWYMVPTFSEYVSSKTRKLMMNSKKKDYVRGWLNEMKSPEELASPRSGFSNDKSSGKHGHHKS
ncbi:hypothetical protein CR513_55359, partial [Mucuna pruriens]